MQGNLVKNTVIIHCVVLSIKLNLIVNLLSIRFTVQFHCRISSLNFHCLAVQTTKLLLESVKLMFRLIIEVKLFESKNKKLNGEKVLIDGQ